MSLEAHAHVPGDPGDPGVRVQISLAQTGARYPCATGESLLAGLLRQGRGGIPAGCLNGGCGVCKVRVLTGQVRLLGPVSRARVTVDEQAQGYTLACRAAPLSDVRLELAAPLSKSPRPFPARAGASWAASAFSLATPSTTPTTSPTKETSTWVFCASAT